VDELTRLFLAARDGDRTALFHAVRASQADVWRLVVHLVGPDDADVTSVRGATDDHANVHAVHALVDALPRDQRVAFVLTQVVGCSYAEAAAVCGVPIGTIRSRIARAREQLLEDLRDAETG